MSGSNGRRLDATPALTALPEGAELLALVPDAATPGRKMTRRIGKAGVVGLKGDKGDPGPSGAADGIAPSALTPAVALSATDETFVIQGGEAKPATLGAVAAAQGISFMILAPAGPFSDADTVMIGQGGEAKRTTLGDLVAHVASKIGAGSGGTPAQGGTTSGALALDGAGWSGKVRAAYSTRKLRSAYAGPCVRVRPQRGAEFDVGFTSAGLLDTTALGGGTVFLVRWYDQSGAGRDFIQTDPARQHVLVENGTAFAFGGRPAIRCNPFDGAWMSAPSVPVTDALCAAMVAEGVAGTPYGEQGNLLIYDAGAAGITVACTPSDKTKLAAYYADGFRDYPAGDPTAGFTARARVAPGGIALSFNGTTGATLAVGSGVGATGALHFGGQPDGGQGKSWEGLASEIVLGDGVADADMAALDAGQRAFFGIA